LPQVIERTGGSCGNGTFHRWTKTKKWAPYGDSLELCDLASDPAQTLNLVRHYPAVRNDLLNRMNAQVRYWYGQRATKLSEQELKKLRGLGYVQ